MHQCLSKTLCQALKLPHGQMNSMQHPSTWASCPLPSPIVERVVYHPAPVGPSKMTEHLLHLYFCQSCYELCVCGSTIPVLTKAAPFPMSTYVTRYLCHACVTNKVKRNRAISSASPGSEQQKYSHIRSTPSVAM